MTPSTTLTATPTNTSTPTQTPTNTPTPSTTPVWVSHNFGNAWHPTSSLALSDYVNYGLFWYTYISSAFLTPVIGAVVYRQAVNDSLFNPVNGNNQWRIMVFNGEIWAVQINAIGEIIDYVFGPVQSPTPSVTASQTPTLSLTPSNTPSVGSSPTPTETATQTPTPTMTQTQTVTPTLTPTNTPSVTATLTPTTTNTPSVTTTQTETPTNTPSPTEARFIFNGFSGSTSDFACASTYSSVIYGDNPLFDECTQFYNKLSGPVDIDMTGFYQYGGVVVELLSDGSAPGAFTLCFTLTPTPSVTPTNTSTPTLTPTQTNTQTQTQTQTPTTTSTPTNTPSISVSPTMTPSPTQSIGYYSYELSSGSTVSAACNNFSVTTYTIFAPISGGVGPNVGEYLYTQPGNPPTAPAPDGYYSNGIAWFQVSGGLGQIISLDPDGC